ncbi:hypothetical protein C6P40_001878, partial [Pichia californica]
MSISEVEKLQLEDLGFQAKPPIDIFDGINQDDIRSTLETYNVDYLAISNKHKLVFTCLENNLKVISTEKISQIIENDDKSNDGLILHNFKITGKALMIKINSDETCLYLISESKDSSKFLIISIDLTILLRGIYNEKCISAFPLDSKIIQFYPSLINPFKSICLLENGDAYLIDQNGTTKLYEDVSAINWFGKYTIYSFTIDSTLNITDEENNNTLSSTSLVENSDKVLYLTQLDNNHIQAVFGESINPDDNPDYTTYFITIDDSLQVVKVESSLDLFNPFGMIPRFNTFYTLNLKNWSKIYKNIFITTSSKSIDIDFCLQNQSIELLNDSDRATMPMDEISGDDDTPLGIVLDLSSTVNVKEPCKGVDESNPLPRIIVLTNRGQFVIWNIWSKKDLLENDAKLPTFEISDTMPNKSENDLEDNIENSLGSLSFGASTNKSLKESSDNPFTIGKKSDSSSLFGSNANTSTVNPFGGSSSSNPFELGKSSSEKATNSSFSAATKLSDSGTNSPFGSISKNITNTNTTPSTNTPFGSSSGFGNTTFGVGGFKMGSSTTSTSQKQTENLPSNSFNKPSFGSSGFSSFAGTKSDSATVNSPFGGLSSNTTSSPFGNLGANSKTD